MCEGKKKLVNFPNMCPEDEGNLKAVTTLLFMSAFPKLFYYFLFRIVCIDDNHLPL